MSPAAPPPTVIAQRYELQRMLAQGGMAEVWLAIDLTLDRKVAVKWLKPTLASDPVVAERFRREAVAAAGLNHPNIVAVHDVFEQDGRQAVVMQLIEGKSLRQLLDTQKRLSPELTCHIGSCVAVALDHAHQSGFVHRDVKPGNIMITSDGRVLLTDFGIAKGLAPSAENDLTNDNIMMGTAKYLSPEQVRGKRLDGRADLYSLGLVLYECLAGRVPFLGETDADTALARLQRDPTDLAQLRATLPTELVVVVHQLLARNPNSRPATGADLAASLKRAAQAGPPAVDPTGDAADDDHGGAQPSEKPTLASRWRAAPAAAATAATMGRTAPTIPGEIAPAPVDPTPPTRAPRGEPARELADRRAPSAIVVGGIVVVALALIAVLVASLRFGSDDTASTTTALPNATNDTAPPPSSPGGAPPPSVPATEAPLVAEPASISTITAFDPEGDGTENDGDAVLAAADGDPTTFWRTVCYADRFMGAKRGVGLVVSFDAPMQEALSVDVQSAPYQLQFFASDEESAPTALDDWGPELGTRAFAAEPGTVVSATPSAPARHMLVLLNELGADDTCTGTNPWRGRLGDITPAG
ncbi:MAG: serine/threonine-protein kinase [Actinomycetota bacterium]